MSGHYEFAHTAKQDEIMKVILAQTDLGSYIKLPELRARLSYRCSKPAILCSLLHLERHGFLTKKYHGNRTMELVPTGLAYSTFRTRPIVM